MNAQHTVDDAYAGFVTAGYAAPVRTGYLLTGDRNLAEDLVQQCLLMTYRARSRLDDQDAEDALAVLLDAGLLDIERQDGQVLLGHRLADPLCDLLGEML